MKTKQNTKGWTAKEGIDKKTGARKVHNLIIVDESGSMISLYKAALSGMNETLESIRESAKAYEGQQQEVTLITFDTGHYNKIFDSLPVLKSRPLTEADYNPCGGTPLYDAMGKALMELRPKVKKNEAVIVTVITDGYENASCEYSLEDIRALVGKLDSEGWLFSYIGANQDSATVGKSMGISDTLDFEANEESMNIMWEKERTARNNYVNASREENFDAKSFPRGTYFNN